jgi:magnesium-transporting ATPase (P-type)
MKDDGILVRNLTSPEIMGRVEEICTGKTSTLTTGKMRVAQFYAQSVLVRNQRNNTLLNCDMFDEVIGMVKESMIYNCEARVEMDDKAFYVPVGNPTEVAFLKFL